MMNANDPALPSENDHQTGTNTFHYSGLTKRELIAAMCLQGFLSNPTLINGSQDLSTPVWGAALVAESVNKADALIAELSKDQSK